MQIADCSKERFFETFSKWRVAVEYAEPMFNYLVYGFEPGSFFTAVLANDFRRAMACSHPSNTVTALKSLVGWIGDNAPQKSWGSWENVQEWLAMPEAERRDLLEYRNLIYTPKEETFITIKESA